ncbi:hypothetical protein ACO2Q0_00130 [Phenylobacterium sp. VNQ135]|uniref:hypothetical protein n=1 Tax=Phenylobacterium sp. VNQ135 TaxID=3400922 RepID=UPI003C0AACFA
MAIALSLAAHAAIPFVLIASQGDAPVPREFDPIVVSLVQPPPKPPPPPEPTAPDPAGGTPATSPTPAPSPTPPPKARARPALTPPPTVQPLRVAVTETPAPDPPPVATVGEAQLAGARTAGSGSGGGTGSGTGDGAGGGCDMVERLQTALRKDAQVRSAIGAAHRSANAGRRALLIWNGEWVRNPGQEGKGLAGVRQAISMEVAFAPEACRNEAMRGLVLISMADGSRVALGGGSWRWTDLLEARRRGG